MGLIYERESQHWSGLGIYAALFDGLCHVAMVVRGIVICADELKEKAGMVREEIEQRLDD